jgi:surfeit locus 1 family protein
MLDKPRSAPVVGIGVVESNNRWNYLDLAFYREYSGLQLPGYLLLLAADSPSGYAARWPKVEDKSGMHIGYAIQWGVFALIALGTFLGVNIKRIKQQ